ncbi:hypothetical protein [uncultured Desulfuromonas sp.]|uniref:hypothetical protein n=1 Tax=uncultured Desulfuromonas sp. TaxID=181013 RepID=UPI002AABD328|nr:hypothetical protein [uncultured Desulfuromonas sp.]
MKNTNASLKFSGAFYYHKKCLLLPVAKTFWIITEKDLEKKTWKPYINKSKHS